MGGYGKWIAGILGWVTVGPLGALLGFALGTLADSLVAEGRSAGGTQAQRGSFLLSLLVLSAAVMKADGKVMKSELEYVKAFLRRNFGDQAVREALPILKELLSREVDIDGVSRQIADNMPLEHRIQLLHYLCGIAMADGVHLPSELDILKRIAGGLDIPSRESSSVFSMFGPSIEDAYSVLGISPSATDEEVKKAYRVMAMKHHPDRVSALGEDVRKAAEERFKSIADAYDRIRKERGIN